MSNSSNFFNPLMYADDSTLSTIIKLDKNTVNKVNELKINTELNKISMWLKLNKLSLNVQKTKYMIFHSKRKKNNTPKL